MEVSKIGRFLRQAFITTRTLPFFSAENVALHLSLEARARDEWRQSGAELGAVQVLARTSAYLLRRAGNGTAHGLRRRFPPPLLRYLIPTTIASGPTRCSTRASRNPTSCSQPQQ